MKIVYFGFLFLLMFNYSVGQSSNEQTVSVEEADQILQRHTQLFLPPRIIEVTDGIYCSIGYTISNMIFIEGTDGIIIVDTTESLQFASAIYEEFRKITDKPLKAIIITHFHPDHFAGANALLQYAANRNWTVDVYAHSSTARHIFDNGFTTGVRWKRGSRQFGGILSEEDKTNDGLGIDYKANSRPVLSLNITHTYNDQATFTVAGVTFQLIHTPGETDDQTTVWVPSKSAVFPGDNIYQAFPNLYAIRGSPYRSVKSWYESLDVIRNLRAEHMIPSHTLPVSGVEKVFGIITSYRDAIKYIYDQTVRYINLNFEVDEIVEKVRLPSRLAKHPYLIEFYGSVDWSIRSVYSGFLGWFDNDPVNLNPLTKTQRAQRMVTVIPIRRMIELAKRSLTLSKKKLAETGYHLIDELQWALELTKMALDSKPSDVSILESATLLYREALRARGASTLSATGRNFYLTCATESERNIPRVAPSNAIKLTLQEIVDDLSFMMEYPLRFKAEFCNENEVLIVQFEFTDVKNSYKYTIRHCVVNLETNPGLDSQSDLKATMAFSLWRRIVVGEVYIMAVYNEGGIKLEGRDSWWEGLLYLIKFLDLMDRSGFLRLP